MLYSYLCNKYSENRTDGAYALIIAPIASTVEDETNTSTVLLIPTSSVQWRNFF